MILYFTGTGNSKYAAEWLSEKLGEPAPTSLNELIKNETHGRFESNGEPFVICYPTYAWRLPRFLDDYLRKCEFQGDDRIYFVATCGDSVGASAEFAEKLCDDIGLRFMGLKKVVMPENYIALFDCPTVEKSAEIVKNAESALDDVAQKIRRGEVIHEKSGLRLLSTIVNSFFYRFMVKAKPFHLEKDCISCGLCVKSCPLNNIRLVKPTKKSEGNGDAKGSMKDTQGGEGSNGDTDSASVNQAAADLGATPVWGNRCTHCMACITICPVEAIEYGKKTQGKRRYRL